VKFLKKHLKNKHFKVETPNKSLVQYILSQGGTELADIIEESSQGRVSLSKWKKLTPHISGSETLPWKDIDVGVSDRKRI
jgi:hypothetical protein